MIKSLANSRSLSDFNKRYSQCKDRTKDKILDLQSESESILNYSQQRRLNIYLSDDGADAPFKDYCGKTSRDRFDAIDCLEDAKKEVLDHFNCN